PRPGRSAPSGPQQTGWRAKRPPLSTPWTAQVSPRNDYLAYPSPQLTRRAWENLDGVWQFAPATAQATPPWGTNLTRRILVPFPMESALSGIRAHYDRSWYRRTFTLPASWSGEHVLLHLGAVDWAARVWVNGRLVGTHRGGYDPFTLDITSALRRGRTQEIIVGVYAPVNAGGEPIGKQRLHPKGIFYTASSGIWQTVWLEPVPAAHIASLVTTPDLTHDALQVKVDTTAPAGDTVQAVAYAGSRRVGAATGAAPATLSVPVPTPRLWSPGDPYLYGLTVRLLRNGHVIDAVGSYFGMRSIAVVSVAGVPRVELNGTPIFMAGTLDQGYWPDGIYTAPTPQALESDLLTQKALGFNTVRKHMKVEPELWYYDTDRLGLIVWQDMPAMPIVKPTAAARSEFLAELRAMIETHIDHPSIVQWEPFNEGWGEFDPAQVAADVHAWDPSRLDDTISGHNCCDSFGADPGDVLDDHTYLGPGVPPPTGTQATEDGEFGGLELVVPGHLWPGKPFAYEHEANSQILTQRYIDLVSQAGVAASHFGLNAAIYTAATDVENEADGLVTYDRRVVKVNAARVRAGNLAAIAAGSHAPAPLRTYPTLPAGYDNVGITDGADRLSGNFDGGGRSYSAAGLAAAGLTPGATVTIDGVPVTWPAGAPGTPDNVVAGGQTILVGKAGTTLVVLGVATDARNTETATGTITYTDGSTQSYTLSFTGWAAATPATGSLTVASAPADGQPGSGASSRTVHVDADAIALDPGKTVRSITLPTVDDGIVATPLVALHVFALGVG
ncbi:MAG: sugar-binding domain-containing protein, partial [Solirubrobacteraceae bacterium]